MGDKGIPSPEEIAGRLPVRWADLTSAMEAVTGDLETLAKNCETMATTNHKVFAQLAELVDDLRARVAALEAAK